MTDASLPDVPTPPGEVRRLGSWAVGTSRGADFAVSRRVRRAGRLIVE